MEQNKEIKILVAAHKKYEMPTDEIYLPIHVGAEGKEAIGFISDNTGDNISTKNPFFCELTAIYWGWKNLSCDYIGLVHYRRHFKGKGHGKKIKNVLSKKQLLKLIQKYSNTVFLPKKRHYWIETNRNQYLHAHHQEGLDNTEKVIKDDYPEYLEFWNYTMKKRSGHRFNMFIMEKSVFDAYCEWLFDILFKVEKMTNITDWNQSEQRVYGYLAERLLDVYLLKNKINTKDLSYMFMEKQNWLKKGFNFIKRKFRKNSVGK